MLIAMLEKELDAVITHKATARSFIELCFFIWMCLMVVKMIASIASICCRNSKKRRDGAYNEGEVAATIGECLCYLAECHDRIAATNRHFEETVGRISQFLLIDGEISGSPTIPRSHVELTECIGCARSLIQIKQFGEAMQVTECGHVFCFECTTEMLGHVNSPCYSCGYELKQQDGLCRGVTNLYL